MKVKHGALEVISIKHLSKNVIQNYPKQLWKVIHKNALILWEEVIVSK